LSVPGAERAGDALDENASLGCDENGHSVRKLLDWFYYRREKQRTTIART
jgi:hypothetical protein